MTDRQEYERKLDIAQCWARHVNNRNKEVFLTAYAGDLVYDGFEIATKANGGPIIGILRDMGSDIILSLQKCQAMAHSFGPCETCLWFRYDTEGKTDGWSGAFVPVSAEDAIALFVKDVDEATVNA